jgi:SAM-dependent methyltransferase
MYGETDSDPLVRYYDLAFGITGEHERAYYLGKMRQYGGPVLDLAGGTGRFTIEAAQLGLHVTYVDASRAMARVLAQKISTLGPAVRSRIETVCATMAALSPQKSYKLVICCDAFFHNLTAQEARSTLTNVRKALAGDGAFVFNIPFASPTFLCHARSSGSDEWRLRGRYPLPDGSGELQVDQTLEVDFITQVITTRLRFRRFNAQGELTEENYSEWHARYFNRYEIANLIELCGLRVVETCGYYDGRPVDENGQLVFECAVLAGLPVSQEDRGESH